jgi:alpha-tubulin suppressor-like RCC1 family protein
MSHESMHTHPTQHLQHAALHLNAVLCAQVPSTSPVKHITASMTTSAALDKHGQLLMWGTDNMSGGMLPEMQEPMERAFQFSPQYRTPTAVKAPLLSHVSVGFGAAAGVTMHGRLATWGWSGYANEVYHPPLLLLGFRVVNAENQT